MAQKAGASGILDIDLSERLHVDIGASCNNNCLFCMEDDRSGRSQRFGDLSLEAVAGILEANAFRKAVVFVSGEPTLSPLFPPALLAARDKGFSSVGVISNGRRFAYLPFARRALAHGLNVAMISIHGPDAATHDALTRTPGAFAQTLAGLQNLNALRSEFPLRINTSTVINQRNSDPDTLARTVALLLPMVDQLVFNVMQPFGRGDRFFDRLMLRYTDTAERLAALFARYRGRHLPVHLVDIPYCCTEGRGIPESARGYVERYVHYEPVAGPPCGRPDTPAPEPGLLAGGAQRKLAMLAQQEHPQGLPPTSSPLAEKHRDLQEQSQKVKREECRGCAYFSDCDGVWRNYVSRFGMEEFAPVRRKEA